MNDALHKALELTGDEEQQQELQIICDLASEVVRSTALLQVDVQNSIQFNMVQQQEMQARYTQSQSNAAHRLNVLAAIFLPVATISSVFGMNLPSGLESSQFMFWITFVLSMFLGGVIGFFVMNVRQVNPQDW